MNETNDPFSPWDRPEINALIFYPRRDFGTFLPEGVQEVFFSVAPGISLGARFYPAASTDPLLIFFHGNGEIASDYDDAGAAYQKLGINLLVFDYRGYGKSNGSPSVKTLLPDALSVFDQAVEWLKARDFHGPLIVMGRSLGSAPALEIASQRPERIAGLIIESGFASSRPLLELMGLGSLIPAGQVDDGFNNTRKIETVNKPTLIIHARLDELIPLEQADLLLKHSGARRKELIIIPGAGHNDIIYRCGLEYFRTIARFAQSLKRRGK